ncbi:MAG: dihydrodipicolinate synthase family protein [Rhodospirillaceae bacterium]|nr:dihydrodipicolinate synthase family protein [Rhodospirillaceae bacterium]
MSAPDRISGVLTPVVTPFGQDLMPDAESLIAQCRWLLAQDVGLAVFGTNSEANSLSTDEKLDLIDKLVEAGIDASRMMPGTGTCAITDTVCLTDHAVKAGCGGVLMLPPFFYKGVSDDGLFAAFAEVIERIGDENLRIYLYHIPPMSQVPLSVGLIERLIRAYPETVVGVKDSGGDWSNTKSMLDQGWDDFRVFVGAESFLLANMQNGGAGCVSATANVNPAAIKDLFENWQSPDAAAKQAALDAVRDRFMKVPMIPALKSAVAHFSGDPAWSVVRPPLMALDDAQNATLFGALAEIDFIMEGLSQSDKQTARG